MNVFLTRDNANLLDFLNEVIAPFDANAGRSISQSFAGSSCWLECSMSDVLAEEHSIEFDTFDS